MNCAKITTVVLVLMLTEVSHQHTFTQLAENTFFTATTPQVSITTELGSNAGQQYTIWGWFRFNGETPAISNILTLRTLKETTTTTIDPNYPTCPYTKAEIIADPTLLEKTEVKNNPNCSYSTNSNTANGLDLLYVNFDLSAAAGSTQLYSIIYLVQNGIASSGDSDMKLDGFTDLQLVKNTWSFFAVSADYVNGKVALYYFAYNNVQQLPSSKTFSVEYSNFAFSNKIETVIAGVELNPYFQSTSGFIGNIGSVEFGTFYTENLDYVWLSYMNSSFREYKSILLEMYFDQYSKNDLLKSHGLNSLEYEIAGKYDTLNTNDKSTFGVRMYSGSSLNLNSIDFNNINDLIKSFVFYFQFSYSESLVDDFVLLSRGTADSDGYMKISLLKVSTGRVASMSITGGTQTLTWQSISVIPEKTMFKMLIGVSISPAQSARIIYWDSTGSTDMSEIGKYFAYNSSALPTVLLNNPEDDKNGSIEIYRYRMGNSSSNAFYTTLANNTTTQVIKDKGAKCNLLISSYPTAAGCYNCKTGIADSTYTCVNYCPTGTRNVFIDTCVACKDATCSEAALTTWTVTKLSENKFMLKPNRKIQNFSDSIDYFKVNITDGRTDVPHKEIIDVANQTVQVELEYQDAIINKKLSFVPNSTSLYDVNSNQLSPSEVSILVDQYCYVEEGKKSTLQILAIVAMVFLAISFIMLLVFTIIYYNRIADVGALWKFMLHSWMKLQLIAFFLLLAINMPCCVKEFLNVIYTVAVRWDHAIGQYIDTANSGDAVYSATMNESQPPIQFANERIEAFVLHNLAIAFIVQIVILLMYVVVKLWDCITTSTASFMYKTYIWMEFTVLIVGYLLIEMHAFVFSFLNFRYSSFSQSYFIICFIIALGYVIVFLAFWIFALIRLLGSQVYFMNPINYNRFYYFRVGYKDSKWANCHDLWLLAGYFVIGIMIGVVTESPVAQTVVILLLLLILLAETIAVRPWKFTIIWIADVISQLLIALAVILFVVIAGYDNSGCYTCGSREGGMCWAIVILLFLAILAMALGIIAGTYFSVFAKEKYRNVDHKQLIVKESNEVVGYDDEEIGDVSSYNHSKRNVTTGFYKYDAKENLLYDEKNYNKLAIRDSNYDTNAMYINNRGETHFDVIREDKNDRRNYDGIENKQLNYHGQETYNVSDERRNNFDSDLLIQAKNKREVFEKYEDVDNSGIHADHRTNQYYNRSHRSMSMDDNKQSGYYENGRTLKPDTVDEIDRDKNLAKSMQTSNFNDKENIHESNYRYGHNRMGFKPKASNYTLRESKNSLRSSSAHNLRSLKDFDMGKYNKVMVADGSNIQSHSSYINSHISDNDSRPKNANLNVFESYANKEGSHYQSQFKNDSFYRSKRFDDPY